MKKVILFSKLTENNTNELLENIFPIEIKNKVVAYMPSDGWNIKEKYTQEWINYTKKYNADFLLINNSLNTEDEYQKLLKANILVISGGNTYILLNNLRKSGLDRAIKEYIKKDDYILAGMSAGALVLTPNIKVCEFRDGLNTLNLENLTGLNIVDFEILPHFTEQEFGDIYNRYLLTTKNEVKKISDDDYITVNLD